MHAIFSYVHCTTYMYMYTCACLFIVSHCSGRHHYDKALQVRQLIHSDFKSVFSSENSKSVDVLLTPVTLGSAPYHSAMRKMGPVNSSIYDTYTVPVNLSGEDDVGQLFILL